ncbi:MAG: N-acetylmuramoyl-L-alanine amidase [Bacteroidia bacterium]
MKRISLIFLFFTAQVLFGQNEFPENKFKSEFEKAYSLHPSLPKGILEAVAYTQTRFSFIQNEENSCVGYPQTFGVFGLIEDGKNVFRNNLLNISQLSGIDLISIKSSTENYINAYATAYESLYANNVFNSIESHSLIISALSELPIDSDLVNNFALNSHLYQIFAFLSNKDAARQYGFTPHEIDFRLLFGDNLDILQSNKVTIDKDSVFSQKYTYQYHSINSTDYPPAIWNPAASCNYSSRNGTQISAVTIHFVQGTYAGCISWFKNCSANASAHYVVRSSDGQVTQMVAESLKAWHVGSENPYTVGIEHEGYVSSISWFTNAMYQSSADLTRDICQSNNINPLRTYYGPSCSGSSSQCQLGNCTKVKGHQHYANQSHTDPGPLWNWSKFYNLINNTYSPNLYTSLNNGFYDSDGPSNNYTNDERIFSLFTNTTVSNISLNFTAFNIESGYDNMFIYDGATIDDPLVGQYSGNNVPPPFTSTTNSLLVEFRSDCGTVASGWAATYTTISSTPTTTDITAPTTIVQDNAAWHTQSFTTSIVDADNSGGSGVQKGYYQVIDFDGTEWRANYNNGFFADNFDNSIHPEWTIKTGTWSITNNALHQSDENGTNSGNTNIYASLTQTLSNRYLYHFLMKIDGAQTNRRAGFHFFCDEADSSNRNNSYFVWFRLDDQKIQIYKTQNNTFGSPVLDQSLSFIGNQWYDVKVIFDRITGNLNVYFNNQKIADWTDSNPISSGNYISFRSGNAILSIDEVTVYRSRSNTINVSVGPGNTNDIRYQNQNPTTFAAKIKSICQDSAGNLSSIHYKNLNVDWTKPSNIVSVFDGKQSDVSVVNTSDSLSGNWLNSYDVQSGIARYWYSIGTIPSSPNVKLWTDNWASTNMTSKNLNLIQGTVYYINVYPENGAGLIGNVISSNGQEVDTTYYVGLKEALSGNDLFRIGPNPFNNKLYIKEQFSNGKAFRFTLIDNNGKIVYSKIIECCSKDEIIEIQFEENIASGIYLANIEFEGRKFVTKLISVN